MTAAALAKPAACPVRERGILFSAPMVHALLSGTKTQTRRIVTVHWHKGKRALPYEPYFVEQDGSLYADCSSAPDSHGGGDYREFSACMSCPYGELGDRLWVRETWGLFDTEPADGPDHARVFYRATDGGWVELRHQKWRPSIFMPRWASRVTLEVTALRIEHVQDISQEDAAAEGCSGYRLGSDGLAHGRCQTAREAYASLWDAINGKRAGCAWADNPWVWVISFRRLVP